jgi:shikimate kinase
MSVKRGGIIFLWGMPGSGKSTVGKLLAAILGRRYLDLDDWIEVKTGLSVEKWISQKGETVFRVIESTVLKELVNAGGKMIVACGGGAPTFDNNAQLMNDSGVTCFLDIPDDELISRMTKPEERDKRPLLKMNSETSLSEMIKQIANNRRVVYETAQIRLIASRKAKAEQFAATLAGILRPD